MSLRRQFWSGKVYYNKNATCLNEVVQEDPKKTKEEKNMTLKGMQSYSAHPFPAEYDKSPVFEKSESQISKIIYLTRLLFFCLNISYSCLKTYGRHTKNEICVLQPTDRYAP